MSTKDRPQSSVSQQRRSNQQSISSNISQKKHQYSVLQLQQQNDMISSQCDLEQNSDQNNSFHNYPLSIQNINISNSNNLSDQQIQQSMVNSNGSINQGLLPDKIDTSKVIEMIRNADLYDLINLSLRSTELKNEQVEQFIHRALEKSQNAQQHHRPHHQPRAPSINQQQLELIFTPPSKIAMRQAACISTSPNKPSQQQNDENLNIFEVPIQIDAVDGKKKQVNNLFARSNNSQNRSQQNSYVQQPLQPSRLQNASNINQSEYGGAQNSVHNFYEQQSQDEYQQMNQFDSFNEKQGMTENFLKQLTYRQAQLDLEDSCFDSQPNDNQNHQQDYSNNCQDSNSLHQDIQEDEEDYHNQAPEQQMPPQPYLNLPTPTKQDTVAVDLQQKTQQQPLEVQVYHHFRNGSFADKEFTQQCLWHQQALDNQAKQFEEQMQALQEAGFKGDQFSFQLKLRESLARRSPDSSRYSSIEVGNPNQDNQQLDNQQISYEQQLKMQHSIKFQQQNIEENNQNSSILQPQKQKIQSNFRAFQQQSQNNRSASSNGLKQSRNNINQHLDQSKTLSSILPKSNQTPSSQGLQKISSTKNLNQVQNNQKSFVKNTNISLIDDSLNKTPKANRNQFGFGLNHGSVTQRNNANGSITTPSSQQLNEQDRSSFNLQRKVLDVKRNQFLQAFQQMNIMHVRELERIKKPSHQALIISRLVCHFFDIFKQNTSSSKPLTLEDLYEWDQIQQHINQQVMKYFNDLMFTIKNKIMVQQNDGQFQTQQKDNIESRLNQIRLMYFNAENQKIFKHLSTNKSMQSIVNFIDSVVNFFADIKAENIQTIKEQSFEQSSFGQIQQFDALINQKIFDKKSFQEQRAQRTKSRNANQLYKADTTPVKNQDNNQTINLQNEMNESKTPKNQNKSGSKSTFLRRDKSQIIQKDYSYQTNKSPLNKSQISFVQNKAIQEKQNQSSKIELSASRKEKSFTEQSISSAQRNNYTSSKQKSISRSPINAHRKPMATTPISQKIIVSTSASSRIAQTVQEFAQRNCHLLKKLEYTQDLNQDPPLQLNYELMIHSRDLNEKIKEQTAVIEQNMKFLQSPQTQTNIDMTLIQKIKQRRKEQIEREKSQERGEEKTKNEDEQKEQQNQNIEEDVSINIMCDVRKQQL